MADVLVGKKASATAAAFTAAVAKHGTHKRLHPKLHVYKVKVAAGNEQQAIAALLADPAVEFAELDETVEPTVIPTDPMYPQQWHSAKIGLPAAWDRSTGAGIVVAVVDGGVQSNHPDLAANLVAGWNVYDNNSNTEDVQGHGTAVAGTIAACGNNGVGVAGVAYGAKIMPIRATDTANNGTFSLAVSAITWAADHGARVVSISWSNLYKSSAVRQAGAYLKTKNGVLVCSANNNGIDEGSPAVAEMVVVSATDQNDALCSWSSYGAMVDVGAPGINIATLTWQSGYTTGAWGTSFATPIVAGVLALVMSAKPGITPDAAVTAVTSTAVGNNKRIDAAAAVASITGGSMIPPKIDWTPTYLSNLPVKWQGGTGCCTAAAATYAMEIRNIIQGGQPVQLSMIFAYWNMQEARNGIHNNAGGSTGGVLAEAKRLGVCREAHHPNLPYIGIDITSQAYSDATMKLVQDKPPTAAYSDALHFKTLAYASIGYSSVADLKTKCQQFIADGCPVMFDYGNHAWCAWGYDDGGLIGLDSRSSNTTPFHQPWDKITSPSVLTSVQFANQSTLPVPPVIAPPPLPTYPASPEPVTGNAMTIPEIIAKANEIITKAEALDPNNVSQEQKAALDADTDALDALVGSLAVSSSPEVPPLPPVDPAPGASWKLLPYDMKTYLVEDGGKYRARDYNGSACALLYQASTDTTTWGYMGVACGEVYYPGTGDTVYAKQSDNSVWKWKWTGKTPVAYFTGTPPGYPG